MRDTLHVHSLHALAYCERLFFLEEVENMKLADAAVYAGRRLHAQLEKEEDGDEWVTLNIESSRWNLVGKVDCVRRRNGQLIPYEHKKGRSARKDKGPALAWPSDRLQIIAYAALVAEHSGEPIIEARIRYHADNTMVRIAIDAAAIAELEQAIVRAEALQQQVERPPITTHERLCAKCSLAPVCLPEEARLANNLANNLASEETHQPLRLFPAEDDRQSLHVITQGARIGRKGDRLELNIPDETAQLYPVHEIGQVVLHGFTQITTQALRLCAQEEIAVHWVTTGGSYIGSWSSGSGSVQRRIRQYRALTDEAFCLQLARRLAEAKARSQISFLLRGSRDSSRDSGCDSGRDANRNADRAVPEVLNSIMGMRKLLAPLTRAESLDSLRGYEGSIGAHYFSALPHLIVPEVGDEMRPDGRNRRPPRDRCNALLSFGYALLLKDIVNAIMVVGLDACLGFYHQPRSQAQPLALDLIELFRVPMVDLPVIASINRRQWSAEDFNIAGAQVWLSELGRKKFIGIYERRKADQWKHPVIGHSLSYARLMELEVRLLEKEWMGEGGLFARMRMR